MPGIGVLPPCCVRKGGIVHVVVEGGMEVGTCQLLEVGGNTGQRSGLVLHDVEVVRKVRDVVPALSG